MCLAQPRSAADGEFAAVPEFVGLSAAVGLGAWLAVAHLGRLHALAAGGLLTRVLLGLLALAGAGAVVALSGFGRWTVLGRLWLALQLVAIRRASG